MAKIKEKLIESSCRVLFKSSEFMVFILLSDLEI